MMLPLGTRGLPVTRADLENALREGLRFFQSADLRAQVTGEFPDFEKIAIDLSGGAAPTTPPRATKSTAKKSQQKKLSAQKLELTATPLFFENAQLHLRLHAEDVQMILRGGADEFSSLEITGAQSGELTLKTSRAEMESLIRALAQRAAQSQGVTVSRAKLSVTSTGPRSVEFTTEIIAQKLFMQTAISFSGALAIDEKLDARLSNLKCSGGGIIGSLACSFLQTYIAQIEGKNFPLAAFSLGDVRVQDVELKPGDPLQVRATFGG